LEPLEAIAFAHSRVRNGFTLPAMDEIISSNERLLSQVFSDDFSTRLMSLDEAVSRSQNITDSFMRQGPCDSSFPTLDGSCNHPEDAGRSMKPYKRLVPADYCDGKQSPRCSQRNNAKLPSERTISLAMKVGCHGSCCIRKIVVGTPKLSCGPKRPELRFKKQKYLLSKRFPATMIENPNRSFKTFSTTKKISLTHKIYIHYVLILYKR